MPFFYDTHAHLDFPDFRAELPQVIERAAAAGISRIITIGTDLESSRRAIELADQFSNVYAAVGCHPCHTHDAPEDVRPALRELARHSKVVAIGETGLDYFRLPSQKREDTRAERERLKQKQAALFQQQLELAAELGLNCVIHQRDAFDDARAMFSPWAEKIRGVFHCFGGTVDEMRQIVDLGSFVSFTGIVTFKNAQIVRETAAATPSDRFMLETDSPYLAPEPHRGKRCEPAFVREIAEFVAEVRGCSLEELSAATCETAKKFFRGLE